MEVLFSIMFVILWGYIYYRVAEKHHNDTTLGATFNILTVIGYAIAGDKED